MFLRGNGQLMTGPLKLGRFESVLNFMRQEPNGRASARVEAVGKFFRSGTEKWYLKGMTYGPFKPRDDGHYLPASEQCRIDFEQIRNLGANSLRLYHVPNRNFLDLAHEFDLRVLVDVPWQKHRCFFEDIATQQEARTRIHNAAMELGDHPALFGISVVNEVPPDIVRYYGRQMVGRFVDELIDSVKQAAPGCLATFTNYPSTEFLTSEHSDFLCFNLYLESDVSLRAYLDRLQHFAGNRPIILGEFGVDSIRKGTQRQAELLGQHIESVYQHGLAGSFVFSYTDEWFTGGHEVTNWAFGIARRDRTLKPAADVLRKVWKEVPHLVEEQSPRVSVVVCSYNGAHTLRECLQSLEKLNYPNYEVILVDDGSTDETQQIAAEFPRVHTTVQENRGLSVARNVGAMAATGDIVAYTDSDCVADPDWLGYLISAMRRQNVAAIGGPNIPPPSDSWTAQCVAASPGGPSHVLFSDQRAEHVPGCNMAFRRDVLLNLGGFDPQFRQAGDDVDICWRLLEAGFEIGFAAGAVVWHHRRTSVRAYFKQQKGYGRSEAMLLYKHPKRFNMLGNSMWNGIIYGEGSVGLAVHEPKVFHGQFGTGLFQTIYTRNSYSLWGYPALLEWHLVALSLALLSPGHRLLGVAAALMWMLTLVATLRASLSVKLPTEAPKWCRPLVFAMHLLQPIVRATHRYYGRLTAPKIPVQSLLRWSPLPLVSKGILRKDIHWNSMDGIGRASLLKHVANEAVSLQWPGVFDEEWSNTDLYLTGDRWLNIEIRTATEELGSNQCFTRAKVNLVLTRLSKVVLAGLACVLLISATTIGSRLAIAAGLGLALMIVTLIFSRRRCFWAVACLLGVASKHSGLQGDPSKVSAVVVDGVTEAPEEKPEAELQPVLELD
ncbi:MAG: glycosyltransferase [Planctomycetes bacterium]|nr:glycosyltransferase [Planctomycetota bacterium]